MQDVDIAIIGAGAAGIAAGLHLRAAGADFCILEARDRAGGRAETRLLDGYPNDLGCGWLHSADDNPWVGQIESTGFTIDRTGAPWGRPRPAIGFPLDEQKAFHRASDAFYARLEAAAAEDGDRPAASLLVPGERWNGLLDAISTYANGTELAKLSVRDFDNYADSGLNWRVVEGYGTGIVAQTAGMPIQLNCPVTRIDHGGRRLRLTTSEGTVSADRAIVTLPTPLLADGALRFDPPLPGKSDAAAALPLGLADKLMIGVDAADDLPLEGHMLGRTDDVRTASYHLRPLGRPLIEAYFGGMLAQDLEDGGPAAFAAFAIDQLAGLFGGDIRRRLRPLAATAWRRDPQSRGSYSYAKPGHAAARAVLAAPVDDRLFFAGEATHPHHFSTAHGAFKTGVRAAAEALAAGQKLVRRA